MNKLDEMWTALAEHQPAPSYAKAWRTMLKERTQAAAADVAWAAPAAPAAGNAEAHAARAAAWAAASAAADSAAKVREYAQRAIDAIREVQP